MDNNLDKFGETAKGLSRNPLSIIALFIVLVYGFAALVIIFATSLTSIAKLPLIYFLVLFPVLVLGTFAWLVAKHHNKLYGPMDYKDEANYIKTVKMQLNVATALTTASVRNTPPSDIQDINVDEIANLVEKFYKQIHNESWKKRILWVDDNPENNLYERKSFESIGITFSFALSTNQALDLISHNKFAVIISDMARQEGQKEGYVLLEAIRKKGNKTPFFIYTGYNPPEYKDEARKKGANGSTNHPQELFTLVTKTLLL